MFPRPERVVRIGAELYGTESPAIAGALDTFDNAAFQAISGFGFQDLVT